jgi:hypothetical protein
MYKFLLLSLVVFTIGVDLPNIRGGNPLCGSLIASKPYVPIFCVQSVGDGWQVTANTDQFEIIWIADASANKVYGSASVLIDGVVVDTIHESTCVTLCPATFSPSQVAYRIAVPVGTHTIQVLKNSDDAQPINLEYINYHLAYQTILPLIMAGQ